MKFLEVDYDFFRHSYNDIPACLGVEQRYGTTPTVDFIHPSRQMISVPVNLFAGEIRRLRDYYSPVRAIRFGIFQSFSALLVRPLVSRLANLSTGISSLFTF